MRRWILVSIGIVAAMLLLRNESPAGVDVGVLEPAQVLMVDERYGSVTVRTDMGHFGSGSDLAGAISNMERMAAGKVFLDTTEYLVLSPSAWDRLPELAIFLRRSCKVCLAENVTDLGRVGEYLSVHEPSVALGDWKKGDKALPILMIKGERMYLANP